MAGSRAPRGMHDLLPEDEALWRFVRDTAERVARLFDYRLIGTPIVEDSSVFLRTVGDESDIVSKEMYIFEDRGGDHLALRPEGTAAVCRAYLEHGMGSRPQPVRLFYFGPMFRYDRPQAGRYRQLWQFGVECIGDPSPAADVEVIELQRTLYEELGLSDLNLRINSIGTAETRHRYVAALHEHFAPHVGTLSRDSQRRFETNVLRILDSKEDAAHPAVLGAPSILDYLDEGDQAHFAEVRGLLDGLGVAYEVDPRIVRGLDYYARTVWEFEPAGAGGQSTVGAGGRYDGLIELLGGPHTPGVGFATGIERIMLNLKARDWQSPATGTQADVYLSVADSASFSDVFAFARELRRAGKSVVVGRPSRTVRAQARQADQIGAIFQETIGQTERDGSPVTARHLESGETIPGLPLGGFAGAIQQSVLLTWQELERTLRIMYMVKRDAPESAVASLSAKELIEATPEVANADQELLFSLLRLRDAAAHGDIAGVDPRAYQSWARGILERLTRRLP